MRRNCYARSKVKARTMGCAINISMFQLAFQTNFEGGLLCAGN
jgi:hypothetical protein